MSDPAPIDVPLGRGERTVAELRGKADELLARIEDENLVPDWCWPALTETLGRLYELPDSLAWVPVAYLSCVILRRDKMFDPYVNQARLDLDTDAATPTVECRCGHPIPEDTPQRRAGREVLLLRCPACHIDLVMYDGEPYHKRTLISAMT